MHWLQTRLILCLFYGEESMKTETKLNIRSLHERMGNVNHQPVKVHSYTNKRFTVNFRVPLEQLRRIIPEAIELDVCV